MPKNVQTTVELYSFHMLARLCSKSFKLGFSSAVPRTENFQIFSWVSKRQRNQRSNCQHSLAHGESKQVPEKTLLLHWLRESLWLCGSQQTGKFLNKWEYQTTLPVSWETYMGVKKQQLEPDMEQWTGSKLRKGYHKVVYWYRAFHMMYSSTSCEIPVWMNPKLACDWSQDCWETYQQSLICRWYHSNGRKWRKTKEPLDECERGEWKS